MTTLGERIAELRKKAGYRSQKALAIAAGLSESYINKLEKNMYQSPGGDVLARLANALGVDVEELVRLTTGEPETVSDGDLDKMLDSPDLELHMLLRQAGRKLSKEARESLIPYLRYVIEQDRKREAEEKKKRGQS